MGSCCYCIKNRAEWLLSRGNSWRFSDNMLDKNNNQQDTGKSG